VGSCAASRAVILARVTTDHPDYGPRYGRATAGTSGLSTFPLGRTSRPALVF
jgi:hypothetical protein